MKLSETDKRILEVMQANPSGVPVYKIAKALNRYPSQIHRRLNKLLNNNIVYKNKSSIALYAIQLKQEPQKVTYNEYACPKCGTPRWAEFNQLTLVCANEQCLTTKGERTRFWAHRHPGRITNTKVF